MAFITALLARWGLQAFIPYILPGLLGLLFSGLVGTTWWFGYVDIPTTVLTTIILIMVAGIFTYQSRALQFIALGVIIVTSFILGRVEEGKNVESRIETAVETATTAVHTQYQRELAEDKQRREQEAELARQRADAERKLWEQAFEDLNQQIIDLHEAATRDANANRPAFGVESIDRLNKLRGNEPLAK